MKLKFIQHSLKRQKFEVSIFFVGGGGEVDSKK